MHGDSCPDVLMCCSSSQDFLWTSWPEFTISVPTYWNSCVFDRHRISHHPISCVFGFSRWKTKKFYFSPEQQITEYMRLLTVCE